MEVFVEYEGWCEAVDVTPDTTVGDLRSLAVAALGLRSTAFSLCRCGAPLEDDDIPLEETGAEQGSTFAVQPFAHPSTLRLEVQTGYAMQVNSVAFSPDMRGVYCCAADPRILKYDTSTGKEVCEAVTRTPFVSQLCVLPTTPSADSPTPAPHRLHAITGNCTVWMFGDTPDSSSDGTDIPLSGPSRIRTNDGTCYSVCPVPHPHSADGAGDEDDGCEPPLCLYGGYDRRVAVHSPDRGEQLYDLEVHEACVTCIAASPCGRFFVTGSSDSTVGLWRLGEREAPPLCRLEAHRDAVLCVAVSPCGAYVASGGSDARISLLRADLNSLPGDAPISHPVVSLLGNSGDQHTAHVSAICFTPASLLLSGSGDATFRVWNPRTGSCLATVAASGKITCMALSADGGTLVTGHWGGILRVWGDAVDAPGVEG